MRKLKITLLCFVLLSCMMLGCNEKENKKATTTPTTEPTPTTGLTPTTEPTAKPTPVNLLDAKEIKVGDYVLFGSYEQDNNITNGQEAIEWLVLDVRDDKAFLVSTYGLDCQPYHETEVEITWENCSLRSWLNNDFYTAAFQSEEQNRIETTTVINKDNPWWKTPGGNDTQDKIFLLSIEEATEYFPEDIDTQFSWDDNPARAQDATAYAIAQGVEISTTHDYYGRCWAWLRTPGMLEDAACIQYTGTIHDMGSDVNDKEAVRPALWVHLESR